MTQEQASGAYLVIQKGPLVGKRVELWKECTSIGRSRDSDIFLEDLAVHRKQASILRIGLAYVLRDDNGSQDSFINGQPVSEQQLNHGDEILLGDTHMIFYANEGTRPFQLPSSRGRELHVGKTPDPQATTVVCLHRVAPHTGPRTIELLPEMTIGRSRDCNIFLEDLAVSRHHATIRELANGHYELCDNRSAAGTYVNGRAIARYVLQENDEIQIGENKFIYRLSRS